MIMVAAARSAADVTVIHSHKLKIGVRGRSLCTILTAYIITKGTYPIRRTEFDFNKFQGLPLRRQISAAADQVHAHAIRFFTVERFTRLHDMSVRPLWRVGLFAGGLCVSHSDFPSRAGMEGSPMPCRHLSQDRPARPSEKKNSLRIFLGS